MVGVALEKRLHRFQVERERFRDELGVVVRQIDGLGLAENVGERIHRAALERAAAEENQYESDFCRSSVHDPDSANSGNNGAKQPIVTVMRIDFQFTNVGASIAPRKEERMRFVLGLWLLWVALPASAESKVEGAWRPESYVLKDGSEHVVTGLIFFTESDWTVLFFVKDADGNVRRGSGEGGTYTLEGNDLTFTHFYNLSAGEALGSLPESPLHMSVREAAEAATEPCEIAVSGDALTIHFPSGNRMEFKRSS
jgi:hypothetical protein